LPNPFKTLAEFITMDDAQERKQRKEEGKRLKRQKIELSGGVRPRSAPTNNEEWKGKTARPKSGPASGRYDNGHHTNKRRKEETSHRFGKVMEDVPCINKPRRSTVSVAVPGSIVANCHTREQKTQLAGQIARAATIYYVDEIIVYDDKLSPKRRFMNTNPVSNDNPSIKNNNNDKDDSNKEDKGDEDRMKFSEPNAFLARVLQFCECPQYLRRAFFPMHPDLQFAGMLPPIDAPHHVRADDHCPYREGVVMDKKTLDGSLVNCGIRGRPVTYVR
jgi:Putative RNA methyltransferase